MIRNISNVVNNFKIFVNSEFPYEFFYENTNFGNKIQLKKIYFNAKIIIGDTMKNENMGFTLVELLAVVALIALLSLVVVPSVSNLVNRNKIKLSSTTQKLIYSAAESYLDANQTEYIKVDGAVYCPTIQNLIDKGFFEENLVDTNIGEKFDKTLIVKSSYNGYKYEYEIVNEGCTENKPAINKEHIAIGELLFYRDSVSETNKRTKVYNAVETIIVVPVLTTKINNDTQLKLKIRRGNKYISGFTISGGIVSEGKTNFQVIVPSSAGTGEYVIEVTDGSYKATKNFKVHVNPIILFMGE